ncbi:hypothetical protein FA15DRAFT_687434 [Coprinopsis marcescibilis]|uniref:HMG box domain-containing protein n=1 Tax=Coprinopsis marcescibilis TaxID=230819 RepID=A0A5C3KVM5_COPMA|nr:hypothetical protein FA15DRAFT_687434 [Coprinopsis marcescibilis]
MHGYSQSMYGHGERRSLRSNLKGRDERASLSGSDDGHYGYHDSMKGDELEGGADLSLTSQTLNADGTPKRPMNAFMIFARRRRPQVAADNQALRTGEVSKLLSKEWSTMPTSEKQFYQEQAKLLKDNFNSKYPDYVYRRRPNNSRRRRRSDASRPEGDLGEDGVSPDSPIDGEDQFDGASDHHPYSRTLDSPAFNDTSNIKYSGRPSSQPFPPNDLYLRNNGTQPGRGQHPLPAYERLGQSSGLHPHGASSRANGYGYQQDSSIGLGGEMHSHPSWQPRIGRESSNSNWVGMQDRVNPSLDLKPLATSNSGNWSSSPTSSTSSTSSHNLFATLTSPFNPGSDHSGMTAYQPTSSSNSHYSSHMPSSASHSSRNYDPRGTSILSMNESMAVYSARDTARELPPMNSISGFSSHSSSSGAHLGASQNYWPRDYYSNRRNDLGLVPVLSLKDES